MNGYSVMIVDDHKLFREGLKLILESFGNIRDIKDAPNGMEFFNLIKEEQPNIVFMDIEMPFMDGIEATKKAIQLYPDINIIALSMYGDENYYTRMINAGAKGFILKNSGIQDIENAINSITSGNNYFSQEILNRLLKGFCKPQETSRYFELTEREQEVLYYICKGQTNQEIANTLCISKRTVDKHREILLSKTNAKNTAGLVIYAVKNNIVKV